jgi:hypothetical protein
MREKEGERGRTSPRRAKKGRDLRPISAEATTQPNF